jgi:UDP-2,4-diacetamido-2,4,6-trideoxy-beta-L-altropyranose hydrolase
MDVLIRCDSSYKIGSGHLIRCLSIAEQLRKAGHQVEFACLPLLGNQISELEKQAFTVLIGPKDTEPANWIPSEKNYDICIIDQYSLNDVYELKMRNFSKKIIVIDDWGSRKHSADAIIDPSISSHSRIRKSINSSTPFYTGSDWLLMREDFIISHTLAKPRKSIQNVLVFFGGTDPKDLIIRYHEEVSNLKTDLNFHFLISSGHPRIDQFKQILNPTNVFFDFSPKNMASYLLSMDIYLGSAGTITWERMCVGLTGLVISIVENQVDQAETLAELGVHRYLGEGHMIQPYDAIHALLQQIQSPGIVQEMSRKSLQMIDGQGCKRLLNLMQNLN